MAREKSDGGAGKDLGFEATLWQAADKLRNNMDAAEYKHVVLGLIFLKYISDAFEEGRAELVAAASEGADPEDPDEYRAMNVFWVPAEARWSGLQANAKQPTIGRLVDDAMAAVERDNPSLKGVLPKDFGRQSLSKQRLGELVDLIGTIGLGDRENRSKDILGRVYEYSTQIPVCVWFLSRNKRNGVGQEGRTLRDRSGEILFIDARKLDFHKVGVAPTDGVCSTDILVLQPTEPFWFAFGVLLVSSDDVIRFVDASSTGTRMPRTSWAELARYETPLPSNEVAVEFDASVRPLIDRILLNIHQSRTLTELRDTLLPKLLSGELRIRDVERVVGEAV